MQNTCKPVNPISLRRRANARNVSFRISLRWPIHIINPVDKTKLSCYTPRRRSTRVSLEIYPSIYLINGLQRHPIHGLESNGSFLLRFYLDRRVCLFTEDRSTFRE